MLNKIMEFAQHTLDEKPFSIEPGLTRDASDDIFQDFDSFSKDPHISRGNILDNCTLLGANMLATREIDELNPKQSWPRKGSNF